MATIDCKFINYRGQNRTESIYSPIDSQHVIWNQKGEGNEVAEASLRVATINSKGNIAIETYL